ncbi:MAG TPA: hypothetical protein VMS71_07530, partial [Candidatus Acidoferrum sp.]|nr:hypothetical protein [Candidatus Acidoferrum sp.]
MIRSSSFLLAVVILFALACTSDNPTGPGGLPGPLPYQSEAEQIALYYTDSLTPPAELTADISRELDAIRRTFGATIPAVSDTFVLPWFWNAVEI